MKKEKHIHTYDENGNITCCSLEEKIDAKTHPPIAKEKDLHHEGLGGLDWFSLGFRTSF